MPLGVLGGDAAGWLEVPVWVDLDQLNGTPPDDVQPLAGLQPRARLLLAGPMDRRVEGRRGFAVGIDLRVELLAGTAEWSGARTGTSAGGCSLRVLGDARRWGLLSGDGTQDLQLVTSRLS